METLVHMKYLSDFWATISTINIHPFAGQTTGHKMNHPIGVLKVGGPIYDQFIPNLCQMFTQFMPNLYPIFV